MEKFGRLRASQGVCRIVAISRFVQVRILLFPPNDGGIRPPSDIAPKAITGSDTPRGGRELRKSWEQV